MHSAVEYQVLRRVSSALLIFVVATANGRADDLSDTIDRLAQEQIDTHRAAAIGIAIDRGGMVLLDKGYGYADVEKQIKTTPETIYRIGSVTKQFTAVAIMQLQAAGKLKLEDPITSVIIEYPAPPKPITIKHLLQHTSGIPDFTRDPSHRPNAYKDLSNAEMLARFDTLPLDFSPGARWSYSNSGYYLLGVIIERLSGESYADYMLEHVLSPAGMTHSRYEAPDGSGRAQGYRPTSPNSGELVVADRASMTQPFAAGALVSTTGDLIKWQRALVDGRLNPPDAFQRITSDLVRSQKGAGQYGYGIRVTTRDGRQVVSHGGGIEGFAAYLAYYPESDSTIAILANTEGINLPELLEQIEGALFGTSSENAASASAQF